MRINKNVKVTDYVVKKGLEWIKANPEDKAPFGVYLGRGEVVMVEDRYDLKILLDRREAKKNGRSKN